MTASQTIVESIENIGTDKIFSISDLGLPVDWWENIRVKLGRMVKDGKLVKIANGKFYKPRMSLLGAVPPSTKELVKDVLYENGKVVGYLTGYSIWDSMGLTTQFSSTIVIGLNRRKEPIVRDGRNIRFVLQPNTITEDNIKYLQTLDAIKFIKEIPDTSVNNSIVRLKEILKALGKDDLNELTLLALKYPPRVRALLGALLEDVGHSELTVPLKSSLNPLSEYKLSIREDILPTSSNWRIV